MLTTIGKIGRFALLIGIFLLVLFFFSDLSHDPEFSILLVGLATSFVGILLLRWGRVPVQPSGRFRIFQIFRKRSPASDKDAQRGGSSNGFMDPPTEF